MRIKTLRAYTHILYNNSEEFLAPVKESVEFVGEYRKRSQLPLQCTVAIDEVQEVCHTAKSMDHQYVYYSKHQSMMKSAIDGFNRSNFTLLIALFEWLVESLKAKEQIYCQLVKYCHRASKGGASAAQACGQKVEEEKEKAIAASVYTYLGMVAVMASLSTVSVSASATVIGIGLAAGATGSGIIGGYTGATNLARYKNAQRAFITAANELQLLGQSSSLLQDHSTECCQDVLEAKRLCENLQYTSLAQDDVAVINTLLAILFKASYYSYTAKRLQKAYLQSTVRSRPAASYAKPKSLTAPAFSLPLVEDNDIDTDTMRDTILAEKTASSYSTRKPTRTVAYIL